MITRELAGEGLPLSCHCWADEHFELVRPGVQTLSCYLRHDMLQDSKQELSKSLCFCLNQPLSAALEKFYSRQSRQSRHSEHAHIATSAPFSYNHSHCSLYGAQLPLLLSLLCLFHGAAKHVLAD
jgi:hypothetical protein